MPFATLSFHLLSDQTNCHFTEILEKSVTCIDECVRKAGEEYNISASQIEAIGITNQRETLVVWNKHTGRPLYNAIVWHDVRTSETCDTLREMISTDVVRSITGLHISTYFSGVKLRWMLDNVPEVRAGIDDGTALVGTIDTWLVWNLSREKAYCTDVTNAGRTMLMNLKTLSWDSRMLDLIGIDETVLPKIKSCSEVYGHMERTLLAGTRIAGVIGDQQAALVGQSCFEFGEAKNTYGTGAFLIVNTGETPTLSKHGLLTTPAYKMGPSASCVYSIEGSVAVAGSAIKWLRDNLGMISSAEESESIASGVPDTGNVHFVPAFSGLFAPRWDDSARGTIVGMTAFTAKAHFVRATLEGVAHTVNDVVRAAEKDMGTPLAELRVDGGASVNNLLMQMQADITGTNVVRPSVVETTALGAAFCAGHAVGLFNSLAEFREQWEPERHFSPAITEEARKVRLCKWNAAVQRSLGWGRNVPHALLPDPAQGEWMPSRGIILSAVISSCATALFAAVLGRYIVSRK